MNGRDRLARLRQISALQRDLALAEVSRAARARERSLAQLAALDSESPATDLPAIADQQIRIAYRLWADKRRAELNLILARQTVEWMAKRDAAALTLGRTEVLERLTSPTGAGKR